MEIIGHYRVMGGRRDCTNNRGGNFYWENKNSGIGDLSEHVLGIVWGDVREICQSQDVKGIYALQRTFHFIIYIDTIHVCVSWVVDLEVFSNLILYIFFINVKASNWLLLNTCIIYYIKWNDIPNYSWWVHFETNVWRANCRKRIFIISSHILSLVILSKHRGITQNHIPLSSCYLGESTNPG